MRTAAAARSHIGGNPETASSFTWPVKNAAPLGFLAQLDLRELAAAQRIDWLPESGSLLFFYDMKEQPWGFDPKDRGSWAVLYLPEADGQRSGRPAPAGLPEESSLNKAHVAFKPIASFPPSEGAEPDAQFSGHPQHQLGGFASPIQGEMELECQLASNGLYCGDESGYNDARAKTLEAGAGDWRLLLQFDTDDDAGAMWGDCGRLYFWIREADARARRFDRAWLILQCS